MLVEVMNWTVINWARKDNIAIFPEANQWRRARFDVLNKWPHRINDFLRTRLKVKYRRRFFRIHKSIAGFQKICMISKIRLSLESYYKVRRKTLLQSATTGISKCGKILLQNAIMQGSIMNLKNPLLAGVIYYNVTNWSRTLMLRDLISLG